MQSNTSQRGPSRIVPVVLCAAVIAGLLWYSQTLAFYGDEGFDLLAAQLVATGKRPYIDFFYQHAPLFTQLTAWWMRLFGPGWRSVHAFSALLTGASVCLAAQFVHARVERGQTTASTVAACASALFIALQYLVVKYATTAQAYSVCLFFSIAAFRLAIASPNRWRPAALVGAGFCGAAAAASSFLALPVPIVLLCWLLWRGISSERASVGALFLAGAVLSLTPLLWLLSIAPHQVLFDTVRYHLSYRSEGWPLQWDFTVLGSGVDSGQGVLLVLLATIGLTFEAGATSRVLDECRLSAVIAAALAVFAALTRPTFEQYFVMAVPFVAMPASIGAVTLGAAMLKTPAQRRLFALLIVLPFLMTPARLMHRLAGGSERTWPALEAIGAEINRVTPPDGVIWTNHILYAAAGRVPPQGLETSVRLSLPPLEARALHIVSSVNVEEWLRAGRFDTVCTCEGSDRIDDLGLRTLYRQSKKVHYLDVYTHYCEIFWDRAGR